ncbi:MAG: caspase family protein [Pseudomonadota bacterium]
MRTIALASTICLAAYGLTAAPALAETRALLVGIGDYQDDEVIADLAGPANDVVLMRDALAERGVSDLTIVTDEAAAIEGARAPTRANILAALTELAEASGPGDLAIVHISGHGTQQPDLDGDEPDGYDEVLLPSDARRAAPGERSIPNAITDDEIGRAIDAIRETGADVWLIVDASHSGTAVRAAGTATRTRQVSPGALFPHPFATAAPARPEPGLATEAPVVEAAAEDGKGGLIAFYSAQSSELAREIDFSKVGGAQGAQSGDGESAWYGFFTAKLAERLHQSDDISYHRLFQAVLADMNAAPLPPGAARQTPYWEGTMRDAPVLGGAEGEGRRQYRVERGSLQAGLVQGLQVGTVLTLHEDALAEDTPDAPRAQVIEVSALAARLAPVGLDCEPDGDALCAPAGQLGDAGFARILSESVPVRIGIAPALRLEGDAPSEMSVLEK